MSTDLVELSEKSKREKGLPLVTEPRTGHVLWYSQRELRTRFLISVSRIEKFFEALREGRVLATLCKKSGRILFPPQPDCPEGGEVEWVEMPGEGELVTWTVIYTKPQSFSHYRDYVVGVARMPNGVNVLAWVRCEDPQRLRPGARVRLVVVKREPEGYLTYELEPIEKQQ